MLKNVKEGSVPTITALIGADEYLNHQIANTHATVMTPDHSWTEKIWYTLMHKDGSLQASFGLGKYTNRNVLDGYAGIMRGTEQRTVRASRLLRPAVDEMEVGPLKYEIIEPFEKMRVILAENDAQPIQFDLIWSPRLPAFFEGRDLMYDNGRNSSDVVRYHQAGTVSGWILIDGEKIEVKEDEWFGFRDHSWGVREHVGLDPTDLAPNNIKNRVRTDFNFNWFVSQLQRPDGSFYELAYYFRQSRDGAREHFTGFINEADGTQIPLLRVFPDLVFRKSDQAVMSGKIYALVAGEGREVTERVFEVEAINPETGFRLNPALYMPWKGAIHGSYKGENFLEGECVTDVNNPAKLKENPAWELRDRPLRIREGENTGYADIESVAVGEWPGVTRV